MDFLSKAFTGNDFTPGGFFAFFEKLADSLLRVCLFFWDMLNTPVPLNPVLGGILQSVFKVFNFNFEYVGLDITYLDLFLFSAPILLTASLLLYLLVKPLGNLLNLLLGI